MFYCFCMFVNKYFIISGAFISKSKRCHDVKPSRCYFYVKMKLGEDFYICISVSLNNLKILYSKPFGFQKAPFN